jgi:FkbM family methyltransferase
MLQELLKKEKIQKIVRNKTGRMAARDRFEDIKKFLNKEDPVIIECGAAVGNMVSLYLKQYKNPKIFAFEPQPQFVEILKEKFEDKENVHIHPMAVGSEESEVTFNVLNRPTASSVMPPAQMNKKYHGDQVDISEKIKVKQIRLDDVIKEKEIDFIKLDIQGYEIEAFKGAEEILKRTKIITTEIEFVEEYKDQPLFSDIDKFMRENGFYLYNLYELSTQEDGQLTGGDAVYLNRKHYE